ncbi:MAG: 4a-hydroxytetrahydrobiopterin dehydratase [Cyanobacteriota bacterium]|nr:4a-hydroxytetrahydrobiopterin dehydratase [Cyanobacteriota bacterium]
MATPLSLADIQARLPQLSGWSLVNGKLHKQFVFSSFIQAFGWMSGVALVAEKLDHHPEWMNVYNRVTVDLVTHDAHGITDLDFELAERMNQLATG